MKYEIQISEEQRVILQEWATLAAQLRAPDQDGRFLIGMLDMLPGKEQEHPGALHSFIL